jgi:hypothetical protein
MEVKAVDEPVFRLRHYTQRCPSGYHMDFYCKYENPEHDFQEFPFTPYNVETFRQAVNQARKVGCMMRELS